MSPLYISPSTTTSVPIESWNSIHSLVARRSSSRSSSRSISPRARLLRAPVMYPGFGRLPTEVVHSPGPFRSTLPISCTYFLRRGGQPDQLAPGLFSGEELKACRGCHPQILKANRLGDGLDCCCKLIPRLQHRVARVDDAGLHASALRSEFEELVVLRARDEIEAEDVHGQSKELLAEPLGVAEVGGNHRLRRVKFADHEIDGPSCKVDIFRRAEQRRLVDLYDCCSCGFELEGLLREDSRQRHHELDVIVVVLI